MGKWGNFDEQDSNAKSRDLFFKLYPRDGWRSLPVWVMLLIFLSLSCWAQKAVVPVLTPYDSLQDQQLRRLERSIGQGMAITEEMFSEAARKTDSLMRELEMMAGRLDWIRQQNSFLQDSIASLQSRIELAESRALDYRDKLHQSLWLAGIGLLLLTLGLFVSVWLHSTRNRKMLEKLRTRFTRLKKALKEHRKWTLKTTRKEVRRGLRSRKRRKR